MFERWWKGSGTDKSPSSHQERFGDQDVEAELAREALEAAGAKRSIGPVRDGLASLTREQKDEFVDRLVLRLALMVMDLQGSERHHHSRPYGLLTHLLAVGQGVVRRLGASFRVSIDPAENHREQGIWVYGGFLMGLLHDLGKILDLDVRRPDEKDRWNPFVEPLAAFCARNGVRKTGPQWWQYRKGRGLAGHAWHGVPLYSLLLPRSVTDYLGPRLLVLSDAMILQGLSARLSHVPPHAMEIARIVAEVDVEVSRADRREGGTGSPGRRPEEGTGKLRDAFARALGAAVGENLLPLNRPGGVTVGSHALILDYPESFDLVAELLPAEVGRGSFRGAAPDELVRLREELLSRLAGEALLPLHARSGQKTELGAVVSSVGGSREGAWVVLSRDLLPPELPLFGGSVRIEGVDALGGQGGEGRERPGAPFTGDFGQARRTGKAIPRDRQARPSHSAGDLRSDSDLYPKRVQTALQDGNLTWELILGITRGWLVRNSISGDVFQQGGYLWFRIPGSLDKILRRSGIALSSAQIETAIDEVRPLIGLHEHDPRSGVGLVRFHPESRSPERAMFIPAERLFPREEDRTGIGTWPYAITKVPSPSGKADGPASPGSAQSPERPPRTYAPWDPETAPLSLFTQVYQAIWDLCLLQAVSRGLILEIAEEFRAKIRRSRLILFPKRKDKASDYYALFWGRTISALKSEGPGGGRNGLKRIEHLPGPLTDDMVEAWGHRHQRATYFDFDRRRLALNKAYGVVTQALTTALFVLRGRYSKKSASAGLPPLPPPELLGDLSPQGLECVRWGWVLARTLYEGYQTIAAHVETCRESPFGQYAFVRLDEMPDVGVASTFWIHVRKFGPLDEMSTRVLRKLKIPFKLHALIMAAEKERRRLDTAFEEHAARLRRILDLSTDARWESFQLIAECRKVLVDQDDQPIGEGPGGEAARFQARRR